MGVYIKGMEMPKACDDCFCWNCRYDNMGYQPIPEECPLVPVPPHGRLGDLDELVRQFPYLNNFDSGNVTMTMKAIRNRLYTAPTVIPAEEADCHTAAPISDR